jgi:hypothetical protein
VTNRNPQKVPISHHSIFKQIKSHCIRMRGCLLDGNDFRDQYTNRKRPSRRMLAVTNDFTGSSGATESGAPLEDMLAVVHFLLGPPSP